MVLVGVATVVVVGAAAELVGCFTGVWYLQKSKFWRRFVSANMKSQQGIV